MPRSHYNQVAKTLQEMTQWSYALTAYKIQKILCIKPVLLSVELQFLQIFNLI